ncbi:putative endoplasmic reticulum oxidoreductin 1, ERO1-like superfamily [Helianthus annuus]|nr:putative endoplasmic reticulum oxidoreductin 1, ERO1-like superfamily [Helianthus annuus]
MVKVKIKSKNLTNGGEKKNWITWKWIVIGPLIAVLLATSLYPWLHSLQLSFHRSSCRCSQDSLKYTGIVEDCCCDYETVDSLNGDVLHPLLQELVKTSFFRYIKINSDLNCPFWLDDGKCRSPDDCRLLYEFPEYFKTPSLHVVPTNDLICQEGKPEAAFDPWTNDDETYKDIILDLQLNPERHTGYSGPSARRVWDAVYSQLCPEYSSGNSCPEKKVLYRLMSGLHSSISVHIATDYLLDEKTSERGANLQLMYDRVLNHPERVQNLYFTFLFVLGAITKAGPCLEEAQYDSGNRTKDLKVHSLIRKLLHNPKLQAVCPLSFDEAKLWQGQSGPEVKQQIQNQIRNISVLMGCVGCDTCRLWGKLQVLGLGTALKILFSVDDQKQPHQPMQLQLQRNEVIALMNLFNRLSESIKSVADMGYSAAMDALVLEHPVRGVILIQRPREPWVDHWWANVTRYRHPFKNQPKSEMRETKYRVHTM